MTSSLGPVDSGYDDPVMDDFGHRDSPGDLTAEQLDAPDPDLEGDELAAESAGRRRPGPPPNPNSARQQKLARRAARTSRPGPVRSIKPTMPAAPTPSKTERELAHGLAEVLEVPEALCGMAGQFSKPLFATAATFNMYKAPLAKCVASVAVKHAGSVFSRWVEKIAAAGPYAEIGTIAVPFVAQILCNFGLIKPGMSGTKSPELLAKMYTDFIEAQQAAEEAQANDPSDVAFAA